MIPQIAPHGAVRQWPIRQLVITISTLDTGFYTLS
jgi:hypothetical protein